MAEDIAVMLTNDDAAVSKLYANPSPPFADRTKANHGAAAAQVGGAPGVLARQLPAPLCAHRRDETAAAHQPR
jgi:hypothetical protein